MADLRVQIEDLCRHRDEIDLADLDAAAVIGETIGLLDRG